MLRRALDTFKLKVNAPILLLLQTKHRD